MSIIENNKWSNLPEFDPSPNLWNRIEADLDFESVAQNINQLPEFIPKTNIWNSINRKLIYREYIKYIYLSGITLTIGILCYFIFNNNKAIDKVTSIAIKQNKTLVNIKKNDVKSIINKENSTKEKNNYSDNNNITKRLLVYYPNDGNSLDHSEINHNDTLYGQTDTTDRFNLPDKAVLYKEFGQYKDLLYDIWSKPLTISTWNYADSSDSKSSENDSNMVFFKAPNTEYSINNNLVVAPETNAQRHKFYIGLIFSMDYFRLKYNPITINSSNTYENFTGYHLGLKIQYDINKKLSLRSGLNFSRFEYQIDLSKVFIPIDQGDPILTPSLPILTQKMDYLSIPLMAGYTILSKGNFKLTPSAGYIFSFFMNYSLYNSSQNNSYNPFNEIIHSTQINIGCEYLLNKKFLFTLEPYFNYRLNNMEKSDWYISTNHLSYGGLISVNYKL